MNTNSKNIPFITKMIASIVLMLVFLPNLSLNAQQLDCDPLPEDTELLLQCNMQDINNPPSNYAPGTNAAQPSEFNFSGIGGVAADYSVTADSVLVVGNNIEANDVRPTYGIMSDPKTLTPKGSRFRIDGSGGTTSPYVVYAEELDKFLVAWLDYRACGSCVYGRFVSGSGAVEGSPFQISAAAAISGVEYDPQNNRFLIGYENNGVYYRTVADNGTVSGATTISTSYPYEGQMGVAVNTNLNEYWFAYAVVVSGNDTAAEDDRIMVSRFDASNNTRVGEVVQVSQTRVGRNHFGEARIAYSPKGGAVVAWLERGRIGIAGVWGRTMQDNGTLSEEYSIITPETFTSSDGYGGAVVNYNLWTDSFFVSTGDWNGYGLVTEIDLSGLVFDTQIALSPGARKVNLLEKLKNYLVPKAFAQALGSFHVTNAVTPYGSVTLASRNYAAVVGTSYSSVNARSATAAPISALPQNPDDLDITSLPTLINQIYVWSLGISVLLALLMSVVGGYYFMTSAGNAEQASKGKEYITSSLIGLVIIFTAYLILNQINPDLVNFNINSLRGIR